MTDRFEKFVFEALYSENYVNPPIPNGYKYVEGEWNNGFVIERCSDGSQFVWIPVGSLDSDGTLDGEHFTEKFGRRNYLENEFSEDAYHETLSSRLIEQIGSVKKYGGFYISRYKISKNSDGKPQSVKGVKPWIERDFCDAENVAASMEDRENVKSHLTYGAEYDSVLAWFIMSGARSFADVVEDSTEWGNYGNRENAPKVLVETGSNEEWSTNNIYDFAGNLYEWTQEECGDSDCRTARGGNMYDWGDDCTAAHRGYGYTFDNYFDAGFRVVLYIK